MTLDEIEALVNERGHSVECTVCSMTKGPRGRSVPVIAANSYCGHDCPGYTQDPKPGDLWPNETRTEFGFGLDPRVVSDLPKLIDRLRKAEAVAWTANSTASEMLTVDVSAWQKWRDAVRAMENDDE